VGRAGAGPCFAIIHLFFPPIPMVPQTLYGTSFGADHLVHVEETATPLLYIDRHLVHEVTSRRPSRPEARRAQGLAPDSVVATGRPQHADDRLEEGIADPISRTAGRRRSMPISALSDRRRNFPFRDRRQGIDACDRSGTGRTLPA